MTRWCTLASLAALFLASGVAADPVTIKLESGEKVKGELVSESDRETVIDHPLFGRLVIPADQIKPAEGDQPGVFGTPILAGWHKSLSLGFQGSQGNSPEENLLSTLSLRRETETWRWRWGGDYKLAREEGNRTSHFGGLNTRYDRLLLESRWFAFVGARYQYDEFEPWEHRIHGFFGPGYHLIQEEDFSLDVFAGPSYTYEFGSRNQSRVEALIGVEGVWNIFEGHELRFHNYLLPEVDGSELRNLTRVEWKMRIMGLEHVGLVLGVDNEYDTAAEDDKINLKYWSSLSYDF